MHLDCHKLIISNTIILRSVGKGGKSNTCKFIMISRFQPWLGQHGSPLTLLGFNII